MDHERPDGATSASAQEGSPIRRIPAGTGHSAESDRDEEMLAAPVREAMIRAVIARVDEELSQQLAAVMHHEAFGKLEGSWRGLKYLVFNTKTNATLKIKLLQASKEELSEDFAHAGEFDGSTLHKLFTEEFDRPYGEPFASLIGDFEFTRHPDDIELLMKFSQVGAANFCPFLSAASAKLFGFDDFGFLSKVRDIEKVFLAPEYLKWRAFRDSEDSRFAVLTLPRVLARRPYGKDSQRIDAFDFEELAAHQNGIPVNALDDCTWMNCAWVLGAVITRSFEETGGCTAIRGAENGGKVEGLPVHLIQDDEGDTPVKCMTEVYVGERREAELPKQGFHPLCHIHRDYAVFFGAQTCQKPKKYDQLDATADAAIAARLPFVFATSRFAHYFKAIARDKLGGFFERKDWEVWLSRWIDQYVVGDPKASVETKARFPLAEARIEVVEVPENPGEYRVIAHLRPWLPLEELTTAPRMVVRIARGGT